MAVRKTRRGAVVAATMALAMGASAVAAPAVMAAPAVVRSASHPILRPGMTHPDVKIVQSRLGVVVTGYFGPMTLAAVKKFQARKGIPTTGNVGPLTWAALDRLAKPAATNTFPIRIGTTSSTVTLLQQRLKMPLVTGYFGTMTESYVKALQKAARLPVTGVVDYRTWTKVGKVKFTAPGAVNAPVSRPTSNRGALVAQVLAVAKSLRGIPYVASGYSPSTGFNCSSYTQYVFSRVGINLGGAYTVTQYSRSRKIKASEAQPGDLIFYYNFPNNFIGHVGIYAGNGMFWHAPRTGRVVSLDPIYSSKVLFGRVI